VVAVGVQTSFCLLQKTCLWQASVTEKTTTGWIVRNPTKDCEIHAKRMVGDFLQEYRLLSA